MPGPKISELPHHNLSGQDINNCFYVDPDPYQPLNRISLGDIFNWIRETATKEGLTVEWKDNKIVFIKNALVLINFGRIHIKINLPDTQHFTAIIQQLAKIDQSKFAW